MNADKIALTLKDMTDNSSKTWYAVHSDSEDKNTVTGSSDPLEAAEIALKYHCREIALVHDDKTYDTLKITPEWAVYLQGEECGAYGRVEAESGYDAAEELVEAMKENSPDNTTFKVKGTRIYIYRDGEYDNWVEVQEVDYDD